MKRTVWISALLAIAAIPALAISHDVDDEEMRAACGVCAGVALLVPLVMLVTSVIIAVWVYRDAEDRGDRNAVLWSVLGFIFNLVGLLIYLLARKQPTAPPPPSEPPAA